MEHCGWLVVDKPAGMTSHDVVARLRRATRYKRFGHSGTLDPDATGVLVMAVGGATRLIQYLQEDKSYLAVARLGATTDSQDASGQVLATRPVDAGRVTPDAIGQALNSFVGRIRQQPPMVSAVHYQGKRLYELARAGIDVPDRPEREVTIARLELQDVSLPDLSFTVDCSGGTYIRTLAHDLGERLGCGAHLLSLRRVRANGIGIEQASELEALLQMGTGLFDRLLPPAAPLGHLPAVHLDGPDVRRLQQGQRVTAADPGGPACCVFRPGGELVAIAGWEAGQLVPRTVLPVAPGCAQ